MIRPIPVKPNGDVNNVIGVWDLSQSPLTLGGPLILLAETLMVADYVSANRAELAIVGPGDALSPKDLSARAVFSCEETNSEVVGACVALERVHAVRQFGTFDALIKYAQEAGGLLWPPSDRGMPGRADYGSTAGSQDLFRSLGSRPRISFKGPVKSWAKAFVKEASPRGVIAVHLKQSGAGAEASDADVENWRTFFSRCARRPYVFALLGDDVSGTAFPGLANLDATAQRFPLCNQLALVQEAAAFMGMAAGPTAAAIYSDRPYVIFKHPAHHRMQMERELQSDGRLAFASEKQRVLVQADSVRNITRAFDKFISESG